MQRTRGIRRTILVLALSPFSQLGRYQLLERIALGGMAEIHLAFERGNAGFERVVVLKVLRRDLVEDPDHVRMFLAEARTIARLNHPNIVHAHELEEAEGTWFIAMEHVPGSSFRELLVAIRGLEEQVPVSVVVALMLQACAGAHAAHELHNPAGAPLGLVHRDISPDNLMVRADGHVKLLDFGIAKATDADQQTREGTLKGKIAYMSPEQCQQKALDRRSDVFSLGVVTWELLGASRLFRRESEYASMQAIVQGEIRDLRALREGLDEELVRVVEKALAHIPEDRFESADEMRQALTELATARGWDVRPDVIAAWSASRLGQAQEERARQLEAAITATLSGPDDLLLDDYSEDEDDMSGAGEVDVRDAPPSPLGRTRPHFVWGGLGVAVGALGVLMWINQPDAPAEAPAELSLPLTGEPLVIGLAPVMDPLPYLAAHEGMRLHLEAVLERPVELRTHDSYEALSDALIEGRIPYASLPPLLYLNTRKRSDDVGVLAFKRVDGGSGTDAILLVMESDDITSAEDLGGSTICFTDPSSTTGYALPRATLRHAGLDPDVDISAHFSGNHLQVLRDVVSGECRAAATYDDALRAAAREQIPVGQLRVLTLTGRTPQDAICTGPAAPADEARLLRRTLLSYAAEAEAGAVEQITGFGPGDDSDYAAVREALTMEMSAHQQ